MFRQSKPSKPIIGRAPRMTPKGHNILVEPWQEYSEHGRPVGKRVFRWTASYGPNCGSYGQGYAEDHASARRAAEDFLVERGVNLDWQPGACNSVTILKPRQQRVARF